MSFGKENHDICEPKSGKGECIEHLKERGVSLYQYIDTPWPSGSSCCINGL